MIRVNLLTSVQDRATMVDGRWRIATPAVVVVLAIPSLALAAWWYWSLHSEAGDLVRALRMRRRHWPAWLRTSTRRAPPRRCRPISPLGWGSSKRCTAAGTLRRGCWTS